MLEGEGWAHIEKAERGRPEVASSLSLIHQSRRSDVRHPELRGAAVS
jgi:hypothetical protein